MAAASPQDSELFAAAATLTAACGRVLSETRELATVRTALGAMLYVFVPDAAAPQQTEESETCADSDTVMGHLAELLPLAAGRREALTRMAVRRLLYSRWAETLLYAGLDNWRAALTREQAASLFDSQLMRAPPRAALDAIVRVLGAAQPAESEDEWQQRAAAQRRGACVALLEAMVKARRVRLLLADHLDATATSLQGAVPGIHALPTSYFFPLPSYLVPRTSSLFLLPASHPRHRARPPRHSPRLPARNAAAGLQP